MWTRSTTVLCLLASMFGACWTQRAEQLLAQNPCSSKMTCSECIRTPTCAWCFADVFTGPRCLNPKLEADINLSCGEAFLSNPESITSKLIDKELSRGRQGMYLEQSSSSFRNESSYGEAGGSYGGSGAAAAAGGNLVQIKPQRIQMKLRLHEKQEISFSYSQAKDYPVDLYYLMDLSRSMKNDKEKLSALGSLLSSTMKKITSNFNIGFGSFVDKLVMPYVSTVPKNLESPCDGCAAPYGFRNQMRLSMDTDRFESAVAAANVSGNLDAPEGGFDAIMQAVVCKDIIGWRPQSRKLLVFSTDAGFHYAGDGKLGGIVQPNDGECHMKDDIYTESIKQDYPSISQINLKVKKNAINVIFAVTAEQIEVYNRLSQHIEGSSTGVLSDDSDNVVELVRDQYNKITSTVEMRDSASKEVQVVYYSSCLDPTGTVKQTNKCDGLKVGDVVTFTAEITLKECPEDPKNWKQTFEISPVGVPEAMTVELEMFCDCECEHPGNPAYREGPDVCNGHGISACGVCVCGPRYFGKSCECSAHEGGSAEQERGCRPANASAGALCSGRGSCVCGVCECYKHDDPTKVISGPYCECDNYGCNRYHDQICAGPERGECVCGACVCRDGYTGSDCSCPLDTTPCRSPENGEICSGHGECQCGQCVCNVDDEKHFSGLYCEKCPTCPGKCAQFKDCVLCEVHGRGPMLNDSHAPRCGNCSLNPERVPGKIEANETQNEHLCSFYDDEDCLFVFVYSYHENKGLVVRAQQERECPKKVPILGIILGVIAAIVLVGLALLMLWKMVTTIHDRREFARFEKERMSAKWDTGENPIYKQATSTFKNPTYAGK